LADGQESCISPKYGDQCGEPEGAYDRGVGIGFAPTERPLPDGVVGPDGLVWIPNQGSNSVSRIDPATNRVVDTVKVGPLPFVARSGFGDMWISNFGGFAVWRLRAG
jgi:YVTN family beta-propeller protein